MLKKLFSTIITFLFLIFYLSGCYQMGRAVGKTERGLKKVERNIENAGKNFEKGYEKEK